MAKQIQPRRRARPAARSSALVFTRKNYLLLALSVGVVLAGYLLMAVEGEVDGVISLYVSPLLLLAGYLGVIGAIMHRSAPAPQPA